MKRMKIKKNMMKNQLFHNKLTRFEILQFFHLRLWNDLFWKIWKFQSHIYIIIDINISSRKNIQIKCKKTKKYTLQKSIIRLYTLNRRWITVFFYDWRIQFVEALKHCDDCFYQTYWIYFWLNRINIWKNAKSIVFFNHNLMMYEMWFQKIVQFMWKQNLWKNHNNVIEIKWRCRRANLMTQRRQKTIHS